MKIVTLDVIVSDNNTVDEMGIVFDNVISFSYTGIEFVNGEVYLLADTPRNKDVIDALLHTPCDQKIVRANVLAIDELNTFIENGWRIVFMTEGIAVLEIGGN